MEDRWISLILLLTLSFYSHAKPKKQAIDVLQAVKFGNCDNSYKNIPDYSYFTNITIVNIGRGRNAVNGQFVNKYSAKRTTASYKMWRCNSELESDCELFGTFGHPDYCATATETGQFYTPIYYAFKPPLTCPLKKGVVHQIRNATVDAELALKLGKFVPGVSSFHWMSKIRMIALPEEKEFGCMMMMFKFAQIRV